MQSCPWQRPRRWPSRPVPVALDGSVQAHVEGVGVSGGTIQEAIKTASDYLARHPEQARSTDSAAVATLVDGLVVRVAGPAGGATPREGVGAAGGPPPAPSRGGPPRAGGGSCVVPLIASAARRSQPG